MTAGVLGALVSRAEMARRLGVTRGTVTRQCGPGGRLVPACNGMAVDVRHPAAQRWLAERAAVLAPMAPDAPIEVDAPDAPDASEPDAPGDAPGVDRIVSGRSGVTSEVLLGRELSELLGREPGTEPEQLSTAEAHAFVRLRKTHAEARKAETLQARIEGRVIARTTVVNAFGHVDVAFRLLLTDAPRAIALRLGATDLPAATATIRDLMGQHLEACRAHIAASIEADDPMAPLMEAAE